MHVLKQVALLSLTLLLCSCGFALRGKQSLPPTLTTLYLSTPDPYGGFERELRQTLLTRGVRLVDQPQQAPTTLRIDGITVDHTSPTPGPSNQAHVYIYYYRINYRLLTADGSPLLVSQTTSANGKITLNPNQLLGTTNQVDTLLEQLRREAVNHLISRLSSEEVAATLGNR